MKAWKDLKAPWEKNGMMSIGGIWGTTLFLGFGNICSIIICSIIL